MKFRTTKGKLQALGPYKPQKLPPLRCPQLFNLFWRRFLHLPSREQPNQEQDGANGQKQAKQNLGNARSRSRNPRESQEGSYDGNYQEYQCPS